MSPCTICDNTICVCEFERPPVVSVTPDIEAFIRRSRTPVLRRTILPFEKANLSYDLRVVTVKLTSTIAFWPRHLIISHTQAESVRVHDLLVGNASFMPVGKEGDYVAGDFFSSFTPQAARFKFDMPRVFPQQEVLLRVSGTNFRMFVLQAAMEVAMEDDR